MRSSMSSTLLRHLPLPHLFLLLLLCITLTITQHGITASAAPASADPSTLPLEPGEIQSAASYAASASTLSTAATSSSSSPSSTPPPPPCDSSLTRQARSILETHFFSSIPSKYHLPLACPFHPQLDRMLDYEKEKQKMSGGIYKCMKCQRTFSNEGFVDQHLQTKHAPSSASSSSVCLASYCDMLDCEHRTAAFDPLTGERIMPGDTGGLYGSGRGAGRVRRGTAGSTRKSASGSTGSGASSSSSDALEHPHSDRCNPVEISVAKLKCELALTKCFPFNHQPQQQQQQQQQQHTSAFAAASSVASAVKATSYNGLSYDELHDLHALLHARLCSTLYCTEEGHSANVARIHTERRAEGNQRFWIVMGCLGLLCIIAFYFVLYQFRTDVGWKGKSVTGGLSSSSSSSTLSRIQSWLGLQQKRHRASSKLI